MEPVRVDILKPASPDETSGASSHRQANRQLGHDATVLQSPSSSHPTSLRLPIGASRRTSYREYLTSVEQSLSGLNPRIVTTTATSDSATDASPSSSHGACNARIASKTPSSATSVSSHGTAKSRPAGDRPGTTRDATIIRATTTNAIVKTTRGEAHRPPSRTITLYPPFFPALRQRQQTLEVVFNQIAHRGVTAKHPPIEYRIRLRLVDVVNVSVLDEGAVAVG